MSLLSGFGTRNAYDVAVVGLGAVGSSVLYQLARRGVRAIGIDRFSPPHDHGSSHGESRITRQAIGEGEAYVPLVLRSNAIWEELEAATGERLLERCGFLFITRDDAGTSHHGKSGFMERTRQAALRYGIAHELLDAGHLAERFPQFTGLNGDERAYYEPGGGYLRPEACIAAQLHRARQLGAEILTDCPVLSIDRDKDVRLGTASGTIVAHRVILATGAWLSQLGGEALAPHVAVHRQMLHWFTVADDAAYRPGATPTFIWTHGLASEDQFYGFPPMGGEVKVARENYDGAFDPDKGDRRVEPADGEAMATRHVRGRLAGLASTPSRSQICHYAVTTDSDFLIDSEGPDHQIQLLSACSGHGFKHAAAVGEGAAQRAIGEPPTVDLVPFQSARLR